jgi:translocation and assembly module TamA
MSAAFPWLLCLLALGHANQVLAQVQTKPCEHITISSLEAIELTSNETTFICGDARKDPWSNIPLNQAQFFLKSFLQSRGYHLYKMDVDAKQHLTVTIEGQQLIRKIVLQNDILNVDPELYWLIYRRPLTPKNIDKLEQELKRKYSLYGYPCMNLNTIATPENESVVVDIKPGKPYEFGDIEAKYIPGTDGGVERRHDAFKSNDLYNAMLLDLTAQRLVSDDMVLFSNFTTDCLTDKIEIKQQIIAGQPRLFKFSIGFDTEVLAIGEVSYRNSRVGRSASALYSSLLISYREQLAMVGYDWYYAPILFRHFLNSEVSYKREYEESYTAKTSQLKLGPAWSRDLGGRGYKFWTGFIFSHEESERNNLPATSDINAWHIIVDTTSHEYEYFLMDPREGDQVLVDFSYSKKGFGSDLTAWQLQSSGTKLINAFSFEPPVWILGLRYEYSGVSFPDKMPSREIPAAYRNFLGGSRDLRGFTRKSIPKEGALTTAYLGGELRINHAIPYGLQPIAFLDWGKFGPDDFRLTSPSYWSPGLGLHWDTFIGVLRFTLARGYIDIDGNRTLAPGNETWQFYASFGEQF